MSFKDNPTHQRYELDEGHGIVRAEYRDAPNGVRALTHFETPLEARGQGAAGRLMAEILADARANDRKLQARCSYAVEYRDKHPETHDVLS